VESTVRTTVLALLVPALVLAGCTSDPAPAPTRFNAEGDVQLTCMAHQQDPPSVDYTDPARADLGRNLAVFKYFALNGALGYCDGAGPGAADRAWAQFYADSTSNRTPVAAILDAPGG
jgi:hypothetical protein